METNRVRAGREKNPTNIRIGKRIQRLMTLTGITKQKDLAKMTDNTDPYISQLLRGDRGIKIENLSKLAKALGVPQCVIISEEDYTDADLKILIELHATIKDRDRETLKVVSRVLQSRGKTKENR